RKCAATDVQHAATVRVVQLKALHKTPVYQGSVRCRDAMRSAPYAACQRCIQPRQGIDEDFAMAQQRSIYYTAERIEYQQLQPVCYFAGNLVIAEPRHKRCNTPRIWVIRCSDLRHTWPLFLLAINGTRNGFRG